jgi:hypothetical protein
MRDYLDLRSLVFHLREGDVEQGRTNCGRCGYPVARVRRDSRRTRINPDGSIHSRSCPNVYARRKASIKGRAVVTRGLPNPTLESRQ